jgi:hypothetical protein
LIFVNYTFLGGSISDEKQECPAAGRGQRFCPDHDDDHGKCHLPLYETIRRDRDSGDREPASRETSRGDSEPSGEGSNSVD